MVGRYIQSKDQASIMLQLCCWALAICVPGHTPQKHTFKFFQNKKFPDGVSFEDCHKGILMQHRQIGKLTIMKLILV